MRKIPMAGLLAAAVLGPTDAMTHAQVTQPLQVGLGGRYYFDKPEGGPEWGIRASVVLLFPK